MLGIMHPFRIISHRPLQEGVYLLFIEKYFKIHSIYLQFILKKLVNFFVDAQYYVQENKKLLGSELLLVHVCLK